MKRLSLLCILALSSLAFGQATLPNISYYGQLTSTCSTPNAACTGGVVAGQGGIPALPQSNTGILGAGSTLDVPAANYNAAWVSISGTYSGSTIAFDVADNQGIYYQVVCARTDVNILEGSEAVPNNQTRAWQCPTWGSYRFRVRQSAFTSGLPVVGITLTQAAIDPSLIVAAAPPVVPGSTDPCQDLSQQKSSVAINISSATTTQLVAISGSTAVYVCGFQAVAGAGTNPSFLLEYGTGSSCGTGTTALTGAMATGVTVSTTAPGPIFETSPGNTILKTPAGNALCAVTGGTTPNFQGWLSFVQQ